MIKLIIVCEDKLRKYGDFLVQLVSLEDDKDELIIGVKDGEVDAVVWTESEYKSNAHQLSSKQHILFIGNSKMIKEKREHMLKKFCEYGIDYRWLGKQAALFVEKGMDINKYERFIIFANDLQPDIKRLIDKEERKNINEALSSPLEEKKIVQVFKTLAIPVANKLAAGGEAVTIFTKNKEIEDQQYTCAILHFYMNSLAEFMGL